MDKVFNQCVHYAEKEMKNKSQASYFKLKTEIWFKQKLLKLFEIPYIEMFITTRCNLKCKNCSNLIPSLADQHNFSYEEIINTLKKLLDKVNKLYRLKLHGGEVFLHPDLPKIIRFCDADQKIKSIRLATNGTIIPSAAVIDALKNSKVVVQISDYHLPQCRIADLISLLEQNGIKYVYLNDQVWRDMGGFEKRDSNRHQKCTVTRCTSLYDGKLFVCSRAAIANHLNLINNVESIPVNIGVCDFRKRMHSFYNNSITACNYCDGDTKYANGVAAGVQEERL